jgi:putative transposase
VKYAWIDAHRKEFELVEMCDALAVSASGYRSWKRGGTPERKRLTEAQMLALIRAIHAELKGAYGSPRIMKALRDRGFPASKERVERLMRENGIRARHKRRFKATTDSKHSLPVAPNLLERDFTPAAPNRVWTADMTYIWTDEGWLYLAVVIDLFNREVVGWSIKPRMTSDIVIDALTMAKFRRKPAPGLIHHSDRGSQYASHAFQARLKAYGMTCSMSRKGNCWENQRSEVSRADRREGEARHNAPTESFFNSLKNERVHGTRYSTRAAAEADLFDYIEPFYNRKRLHSTLGFASPEKYLADWISAQHEERLAA